VKPYKILFIILTAIYSLLPALLYSQVDTAWVRRYDGPSDSTDRAYAIALDNSGNIYVTGFSISSTSSDYATIKYNSNGDMIWLSRYDGPANSADSAQAITVDNAGYIYVTGASIGSGTSSDYATIKYNADGDTLWVSRYNGPGNSVDRTYAIALDNAGNVYVTGSSYMTSTGNADYVTIKYRSNGDTAWLRSYNGPNSTMDYAYAIAVDASGNVFVTGGSYALASAYDYATIKYDSLGAEQWLQRYNGPGNGYDYSRAIVLDAQSNVYITGASTSQTSLVYYDYATIKYNADGVQQWLQRYNGPGNYTDDAQAIVLDNSGNVYVTGHSCSGTTLATRDYATVKYNAFGIEQWVQRYNGPGNYADYGRAIAVDNSGNVYVTGYSASLSTTPYNYDYATIKYVQTQGINELMGSGNGELRVSVYPNPARNYLTIRFSQTADHTEIKIFNVTGNVVKEFKSLGVGELRVSLNGIKNGVYFVKIGEEIVREKLVVTK